VLHSVAYVRSWKAPTDGTLLERDFVLNSDCESEIRKVRVILFIKNFYKKSKKK